MTRIETLVDTLGAADPNERARALAELVGAGRRATPALIEALAGTDPSVRVQVAQALAEIADPSAEQAYVDLPDLLHYPSTLAVQALIAQGPKAAVAAAPLLQAPSPVTRERAVLVLRSLAGALPDSQELAAALARYDPYADETDREAAAEEIIRLVGA